MAFSVHGHIVGQPQLSFLFAKSEWEALDMYVIHDVRQVLTHTTERPSSFLDDRLCEAAPLKETERPDGGRNIGSLFGPWNQSTNTTGLSRSGREHLDSGCSSSSSGSPSGRSGRGVLPSPPVCEHLPMRSNLPFSVLERVINASSSSLWLRWPQVRVSSCVWR